MINVQYPPKQKVEGAEKRFGVCVKPLYNKYDKALGLVEFIRMYKIQGVTDFTFYIHSIGPGVERVLQYYADHSADTGVTVNVCSWNLPLQSQMKI